MAWFAAIVGLAFFAEAIVGFGATVLSVTFAGLLLPIEVILPALVPVNMVLSLVLVMRGARQVDRPLLLRRIGPLVAVGTLVGLGLFQLGSGGWLRLVFALFVIVLAIVELMAVQRAGDAPRPPLGQLPASALLLLGGVVHGIFGSGGPLVVYVAGREIGDKARFRATLAALWLALNGALVASYARTGLLNRESARASLWLLPAVPLALAAGEWVHQRVPERPFRSAVWCLLLFGGIALATRAFAS
jgi:uncharacterized membrane protein YfcA